MLDGGRLLLQPDGADRRIPALYWVASAPGAALIAHRAEKRGSVRRVDHDGQAVYTKVVRPGRLSAKAGARVRVDGVRVPKVTAVDPDGGTMDCRALPGRTLRDILADPTLTTAEVIAAGRAVGGAVARLHACPPPSSLRRHDATQEVAVTRSWLRQAWVHGLLDDTGLVRQRLDTARGLLADTGGESAFLHRDLHDKQVVVDGGDAVGILDLDLAATGEPALDLANLLVHLELNRDSALPRGHAPVPTPWWTGRLRPGASTPGGGYPRTPSPPACGSERSTRSAPAPPASASRC